jgi:hypothetical protein
MGTFSKKKAIMKWNMNYTPLNDDFVQAMIIDEFVQPV